MYVHAQSFTGTRSARDLALTTFRLASDLDTSGMFLAAVYHTRATIRYIINNTTIILLYSYEKYISGIYLLYLYLFDAYSLLDPSVLKMCSVSIFFVRVRRQFIHLEFSICAIYTPCKNSGVRVGFN